MAATNGVRVALQLSGHLRNLCDGPTQFEPLAQLVAACRAVAAVCDLFVHTWDELHARTPTWHTWYPSDIPAAGASSQPCVEMISRELRPANVFVERQVLRRRSNDTWTVFAGRHAETHVSLAGLRSAIYAVKTASRLRRAHERTGKALPYDVAVRLRPDIYHRRNVKKNDRRHYRGVPINQICTVPPVAWSVIAHAGRAGAGTGRNHCATCVRACDDETVPGNKSGDMCFWSSPPSALDRLVSAWDDLADEYLDANVCWQQRMQQQQQQGQPKARRSSGRPLRGRRGHSVGASATESYSGQQSCAHPETMWDPSAAELILSAAASREKLFRAPLHSEVLSAQPLPREAPNFVPRSAKCT